MESGREIGRELADGAQTLVKVAGNGERPLTGFRLTGVNWFGGGSAGFQMSSPIETLPVLDTFRTFFRAPPLDFALQYKVFRDGFKVA